MFMRHISLCIILQLVHTENCADLKNVEFAGSIINKRCQNLSLLFRLFFIYFIQNAVLRRKKSSSGQCRSESKKKIFFFLGSGPKIGSVGTWETDNQLDVPLAACRCERDDNTTGSPTSRDSPPSSSGMPWPQISLQNSDVCSNRSPVFC